MKNFLLKFIPSSVLSAYHKALAVFAAWVYRYPSEEMVVIGVTGTNGKSTTVNLIGQLLMAAGKQVGWATTVNFRVAEREWLNATKMTMLGRFQLQKLLREMVDAGCEYAIIETSSQGIAQWRHYGINYDVAVFMNLTPEHIESHGGFENYKAAKGELFKHLTQKSHKTIGGKIIQKQIVVNADDEFAKYFLGFGADKKHLFSLKESPLLVSPLKERGETLSARGVIVRGDGSTFSVNGKTISLPLLGLFNVQNAIAALTAVVALGVPFEKAANALVHAQPVPGRMEFINVGQRFQILIDYAPEPASMQTLLAFLEEAVVRYHPHDVQGGGYPRDTRVIHVLGSAGGGRDVSRRPVLGKLAGEFADVVIVTNEDPYDEDPQKIIDQVAQGAKDAGKNEDRGEMFRILDRREAIRKALELGEAAGSDGLVLITGKGAEQAMCIKGGRKLLWDDRAIVRELLKEMGLCKVV
ncbi:MAG: UDP-N-acetylmuramoyl-L-alanyl-D-glutamate--2,6-diaminopimelate ligase [bacterium]|nr:UDP-N-acetylmuramoyl-L-alanyl-D-glutamate--2,6-diaminopimelate ligase [bacterium]